MRAQSSTQEEGVEVDGQMSRSKAPPLPTPEEKMRQQAQAVLTDIVPIDVTGKKYIPSAVSQTCQHCRNISNVFYVVSPMSPYVCQSRIHIAGLSVTLHYFNVDRSSKSVKS